MSAKTKMVEVDKSSVMRLRLKRTAANSEGFGFGIKIQDRGAPPTLQVVSLVKGCEAEKSGLIRPGDIILRINNVDVASCTYDEAIQTLALMPIGAYVSFVVRVPLGYATRLVTTFDDDGQPRTLRITEKAKNNSTSSSETSKLLEATNSAVSSRRPSEVGIGQHLQSGPGKQRKK